MFDTRFYIHILETWFYTYYTNINCALRGRDDFMATYEARIYQDDELIVFLIYEADALPKRMHETVLHELRSLLHQSGEKFVQAAILRNSQYIGCIHEGQRTRQYMMHNRSGRTDEYVSYYVIEKK